MNLKNKDCFLGKIDNGFGLKKFIKDHTKFELFLVGIIADAISNSGCYIDTSGLELDYFLDSLTDEAKKYLFIDPHDIDKTEYKAKQILNEFKIHINKEAKNES